MAINKIFGLICIKMLVCLLVSCDATVAWTGQTYSGTITKNSQKGVYEKYMDADFVYEYHNIYDVGCAGTWTIEVVSCDNVNILIDIRLNGCENAQTLLLTSTNDRHKFTYKFDTVFRIYLRVIEDEATWVTNGYKARYTIKTELN